MKRSNRQFLVPLIVLTLALPSAAWGSGDPDTAPDYTDPETLARIVEEEAGRIHLVDVRTPQEYASGHIPTAVNIEYTDIGENPPTDDKDAPIVVYCRSGNRSGVALRMLEELGYTNVHNFGAVSKWPNELVTGDQPTKQTQREGST